MEEKKLKQQLIAVRLKSNTQLPDIVKEIMKDDRWAPIKLKEIYQPLLMMADILPSTYYRIHTIERVAHLSRGYYSEKKGIYKEMVKTEKAVIHSIEKDFEHIDLEPYQKIPGEGISLYSYQQLNYNKRLLTFIKKRLGDPFERTALIENLSNGPNTRAGRKLSGTLERFVQEGKLIKITGHRGPAYTHEE